MQCAQGIRRRGGHHAETNVRVGASKHGKTAIGYESVNQSVSIVFGEHALSFDSRQHNPIPTRALIIPGRRRRQLRSCTTCSGRRRSSCTRGRRQSERDDISRSRSTCARAGRVHAGCAAAPASHSRAGGGAATAIASAAVVRGGRRCHSRMLWRRSGRSAPVGIHGRRPWREMLPVPICPCPASKSGPLAQRPL